MTAEIWSYVGYTSLALAGVMLLVSVLLFWKLQIPSVIGFLTGKTAVKQIREMKQKSGREMSRRNASNGRNEGKITERFQQNELSPSTEQLPDTVRTIGKAVTKGQTDLLVDATTPLERNPGKYSSDEATTLLFSEAKEEIVMEQIEFRVTNSIIDLHTLDEIPTRR